MELPIWIDQNLKRAEATLAGPLEMSTWTSTVADDFYRVPQDGEDWRVPDVDLALQDQVLNGDPGRVEDVYPCRQDRWVLGVLGPDGDRANPDIGEPQLGVVVTWENLQKTGWLCRSFKLFT